MPKWFLLQIYASLLQMRKSHSTEVMSWLSAASLSLLYLNETSGTSAVQGQMQSQKLLTIKFSSGKKKAPISIRMFWQLFFWIRHIACSRFVCTNPLSNKIMDDSQRKRHSATQWSSEANESPHWVAVRSLQHSVSMLLCIVRTGGVFENIWVFAT